MRIAHLSTFPHMKCGIAFYTADLIAALPRARHDKYALHYGKNLTPDAEGHADVRSYKSVRSLAETVSHSSPDIISLQHEFGIWGGENGEHIVDFLDRITTPVVATLHTTFTRDARPAIQSLLLGRLVDQSASVFVLSERSRETLCSALDLPREAISVLPHGVPNVAFKPTAPPRGMQPWRFCAVGFFRPNKGIEETLRALAILRKDGVRFRFVMAGSPQQQFAGQTAYLEQLQALITTLGLHGAVRLRHAFLSRAQQLALISSSHAGIFAYQDPDQSSSGTIPLVLASGRPVICTPFEFAKAKRQDLGEAIGVGSDFTATALADALRAFIESAPSYERLSRDLYFATRPWLWTKVARVYERAFLVARDNRVAAMKTSACTSAQR